MKIAVIGLGGIGRRHVENFRALGCEVKGWDSDPMAASDTYLLDDTLDGADGVVIATPPDSHIGLTVKAIDRGARVMVEKPVCLASHDGFRLPDPGRVLVAYPWRHWPPLQDVKQMLDEGRIGRVLSASTTYGYHLDRHGPHANRPDSYMRDLSRGGGCLLDTSHATDYLRWLCGEITEVSGVVETRALAMQADDSADLVVRFASGAVGTLRLSLFMEKVTSRLEVQGERGSIRWDQDGGVAHVQNNVTRISTHLSPFNDMYLAEARHFLACIRGEETPVCDWWDGLKTLRVIEAARKASEEKRWVTV